MCNLGILAKKDKINKVYGKKLSKKAIKEGAGETKPAPTLKSESRHEVVGKAEATEEAPADAVETETDPEETAEVESAESEKEKTPEAPVEEKASETKTAPEAQNLNIF